MNLKSSPVLLVERDAGVASNESDKDREANDASIPASADVHSQDGGGLECGLPSLFKVTSTSDSGWDKSVTSSLTWARLQQQQ